MFSLDFLLQVLLRSFLAVVIGGVIGSERARHGRAAGMRTHILVCLGSAMTSMTSMYVSDVLMHQGDVLRIPAQVISGIGFLGAGMIIFKSNNVIIGLTTAAGVWTTAVIGIGLGYGFYSGAIIVTVLFLATIILFAKFEKRKKATEVIYIEIDDMYKTNEIIEKIKSVLNMEFTYRITAPKSDFEGHLGISLIIDKRIGFEPERFCQLDNVVFVAEE